MVTKLYSVTPFQEYIMIKKNLLTSPESVKTELRYKMKYINLANNLILTIVDKAASKVSRVNEYHFIDPI